MNQVITLVALGLVSVTELAGGSATGRAPEVRHLRPIPSVQIWTNRDVYQRGDRAHAWFQTDYDAYVTVFQINTDGHIRVLYPHKPWYNNFVPGGRRFEVWDPHTDHTSYAFRVDDYPGQGYLLAVASTHPFEYSALVWEDRWDYRAIAYDGRIAGDPYAALMDVIDHIVPYSEHADYTYDVYSYHVDRQYDYPRFLCYDCHGYKPYYQWDPYRHSCARFRVVIYDNHYYYPTRQYRSTRVVYVKPRRIEARYVFKERTKSDSYVTRVRERPITRPTAESTGRRVVTSDRSVSERVRAPDRQPIVHSDQQRRTVKIDSTEERRAVVTAQPRNGEPSREQRTFRRKTESAPPVGRAKPKLERREVQRSDGSTSRQSNLTRREPKTVTQASARDKSRAQVQQRKPKVQESTTRKRPKPKRPDAKKPEDRKRRGSGN